MKAAIKRIIQKLFGINIYRTLPFGLDPLQDIVNHLGVQNPIMMLDVGANVGTATTNFLAHFSGARVICFEPITSTFSELKKRFTGSRNVECWNLGLGNKAESKEMYLSSKDSKMNSLVSNDSTAAKELVQLTTLDDFCSTHSISHIDFLKIDTEGNDLNVLKGSKNLLTNHEVSVIMVEVGMNSKNSLHVQFHDIADYLDGLGYMIFGLYNQVNEWPSNKPYLRVCDALFVSTKHF